MQFAKKRRRRRRRPAPGRFTAALIAVCLAIYLVTASAAGKWLAEEVMAPAFASLSKLPVFAPSRKDKPDGENSAGALSVSLNGGRHLLTAGVEAPAMECFALQMGVFSSEANAEALSKMLMDRGAGGYVLEDGGRYRVLASAYGTREEAKTVKRRLADEGTDCAVYTLSAPGLTLSVSAGKEQINHIKNGFSALHGAQAELCAACIDFDSRDMSPSEGAALARDMEEDLSAACNPLYDYRDSSPAMASLADCCGKCMAALSDLTQGPFDDSRAFSARMKYALLRFSDAYCSMLRDMAA